MLGYLAERAGTEFDASIVRAFAMMQAWDQRVARTDAPERGLEVTPCNRQ